MVNAKDLRKVRRCNNRDVRKVILSVLRSGVRYRMTKNGIMLLGPNGGITAHFSVSDHRGYLNLIADLRRAGIDYQGK